MSVVAPGTAWLALSFGRVFGTLHNVNTQAKKAREELWKQTSVLQAQGAGAHEAPFTQGTKGKRGAHFQLQKDEYDAAVKAFEEVYEADTLSTYGFEAFESWFFKASSPSLWHTHAGPQSLGQGLSKRSPCLCLSVAPLRVQQPRRPRRGLATSPQPASAGRQLELSPLSEETHVPFSG